MNEHFPPQRIRLAKLFCLAFVLCLSPPPAFAQARPADTGPEKAPAGQHVSPADDAARASGTATGQTDDQELRKKQQEVDALAAEVGKFLDGVDGSSPPEAFDEALRKAR